MAALYQIQPKIRYQGKLYDIVKLEDPDPNGKWRLASIRDDEGNVIWNIKNFEVVVELGKIVKELAKKGGQTTKSRKGSDYYKEIGRLGANKRWKK